MSISYNIRKKLKEKSHYNANNELYVEESYSELRLLNYPNNPASLSCDNLIGATLQCRSPLLDDENQREQICLRRIAYLLYI